MLQPPLPASEPAGHLSLADLARRTLGASLISRSVRLHTRRDICHKSWEVHKVERHQAHSEGAEGGACGSARAHRLPPARRDYAWSLEQTGFRH